MKASTIITKLIEDINSETMSTKVIEVDVSKHELKNMNSYLGSNHTQHVKQLPDGERTALLIIRMITLMIVVAILVMHVRSVRVFKWEHTVSGGVLVTNIIGVAGLLLTAGVGKTGSQVFQIYVASTGAALLILNAVVLYSRWKKATMITHAVAELLTALGIPLRRQLYTKVVLCIIAAVLLTVDILLTPFFTYYHYGVKPNNK